MALFALLCLVVNGYFYHRRTSPTQERGFRNESTFGHVHGCADDVGGLARRCRSSQL
jgi:hypothetical protein